MSDSDSNDFSSQDNTDNPLLPEPETTACLKIPYSNDVSFAPIASLTPVEETARYRMRQAANRKTADGGKGRTVTPGVSSALAVDLEYANRNNINNDDILYAPFPIKSMAPTSFLEQLAQMTLHAHVLQRAEDTEDMLEQTAFTAAFVIALVRDLQKNATVHAFMPVLGETFELSGNKVHPWRFFAEQVEADVTAISLKSPGFHFQQNLRLQSKFEHRRKLFTVFPTGAGYIVFDKTENEVSWSFDGLKITCTKPKDSSEKRGAAVDGSFVVRNKRGDNGLLVFQESDATARTPFHAMVYNRERSRFIGLNGDFNVSINGVFQPPKLRPGPVRSPIREPFVAMLVPLKKLKPDARLKYSREEILRLPPTDSRFRADVKYLRRALEAETDDEANLLFAKAQRKHEKYLRHEYSRRVACTAQGPYQDCDNGNGNVMPSAHTTPLEDPLWFERFVEGGHIRYRYNEEEGADYWAAREDRDFSRCPDPFAAFVKKKY
uniref:Oxysterol-binding protein n=1 Tax=Steinernema glaseri TaxID=37863 RepID=A0A1I8A8S7_9BILA